MWRKAWFLPTGMWFVLLALEWAVPSIVGFDGRFARLQFLCGVLQFPGLILGLLTVVRRAGRDVTSIVMFLCAVLGVASFMAAVMKLASIH